MKLKQTNVELKKNPNDHFQFGFGWDILSSSSSADDLWMCVPCERCFEPKHEIVNRGVHF